MGAAAARGGCDGDPFRFVRRLLGMLMVGYVRTVASAHHSGMALTVEVAGIT